MSFRDPFTCLCGAPAVAFYGNGDGNPIGPRCLEHAPVPPKKPAPVGLGPKKPNYRGMKRSR